MQEASETQSWLNFISLSIHKQELFDELDAQYEKLSMLNSMEMNSDKFCF